MFYPSLFTMLSCLGLCSSLTYHYGDGSFYVGTVDGDGRPREGVQYSREGGVRYNGSYMGGQYHGEGRGYGEGGESYHGQFIGGEASGRGVWTNERTGERVAGLFKNGAVSEKAVWYRPDIGVRIEGVFRRGHAHGPGDVVWNDTDYR